MILIIIGTASSRDLTGSWSESGDSTGTGADVSPQALSPDQQTYSEFAQYFSMDLAAPQSDGNITGAESYDIQGQEPSALYIGGPQRKAVSYSQFQSYAIFTGGNTLWIKGTAAWTQYVQVPEGASLSLIAATPSEGDADFYEIFPSGQLEKNSFYFTSYNRIGFYADTVGQHILLFVIENQASNAVIIDVQPYYPGPIFPGPYSPAPGPSLGMAKINIISTLLKGYEIYLDDVYQFTEGEGGIPDGRCSFAVTGNANHKIAIKLGGYRYSQTRYFQSGREYTVIIG